MTLNRCTSLPRQRGHSHKLLRATELHDSIAPSKSKVIETPISVQRWLNASVILREDWETLPGDVHTQIAACTDDEQICRRLVEHRVLTDYQAKRLRTGSTHGLVLGSYRVLNRLGAGGMGVVFLAEHVVMRRQVAIKVLPLHIDQDERLLQRFMTEMRTVARLQHPNIVYAIDAGAYVSADNPNTTLHYFVMEYVPGTDLEDLIRTHGPLTLAKTADLIYQIASALAEANKHKLVHRDIKPSNIQVTPEGQAKLLDFGLTRALGDHQMTEPGVLLGTLDFIAPEQVRDAHTVDIRADLYGLGGVMWWCLTAAPPFASVNNLLEVAGRFKSPPPSIRAQHPELPPEFDAVVTRLLAVRPEDRFETPQAVMSALMPFIRAEGQELLTPTPPAEITEDYGGIGYTPRLKNILIVDDESSIRSLCRAVLQSEGMRCDESAHGAQALAMVRQRRYDLVLCDVNMPDMLGTEVCKRLRDDPPGPNMKIVMMSGGVNADIMAQLLLSGADDFLTKPFSVIQLQARVKAALRLKDAQDRADHLNHYLRSVNHELEQCLDDRDHSLVQSRNAMVLALAKLVEHRLGDDGDHLRRMQQYTRLLAEEAAKLNQFAGQIDAGFIELLECCAPVHDIGKIALPDHILLKPSKLEPDERLHMQTHTTIGADTIEEIAEKHSFSSAFLQMATDVVRHHHERFDGTGYPDRLTGSDIPLAARIVSIADVYDALRTRRVYKPALSHTATLEIMLQSSDGHFDPALLQVLHRVEEGFARIYRESLD
jgi:response regulator RpfG family c-di-GMP phosphodiesterase/tRNA A-37 threonylcarbamoyl transferase component Bud32